jgi:hypothetical protein
MQQERRRFDDVLSRVAIDPRAADVLRQLSREVDDARLDGVAS